MRIAQIGPPPSPPSDDSDAPMAPTNLPPPEKLPDRRLGEFFGDLFLRVGNEKLPIPRTAVVRDYGRQRASMSMEGGPTVPNPAAIVVLGVLDPRGYMQYGWYMRWKRDEHRLKRLSRCDATRLYAVLQADRFLKLSSLNTMYVDCYFASPHVDFGTLLAARLQNLQRRHRALCDQSGKRERSTRGKKRARGSKGQCAVCLDNVEIRTSCCGAATCAKCSAKLRSMCPVCDREKLNAPYHCNTCHAVVPLNDYGLPCASCGKCVLCRACYVALEECVACDALRV